MKNLLILAAIILGLAACQSADTKSEGPRLTAEEKRNAVSDTANYSAIKWLDSTILNLGKVKMGAIVEVSFRFKNVGNKPLVIADVQAGCGCTTPEKPEQPFEPGKEGLIKAKFDTKGQHLGENAKYVTVTSNTNPSATTLIFKVEITE